MSLLFCDVNDRKDLSNQKQDRNFNIAYIIFWIYFVMSIKTLWAKIPVRFGIWLMIFTGCLISYMLRVNIGLTIIAMVKDPSDDSEQHKNEERFAWNNAERALIMGAYFWTFALGSFFGGTVSERFGPRLIVLICHIVSCIMTAGSPLFARWHYMAFMFTRFVLGLAGGVVYPACHVLVARWAPPDEKGKFVSATVMGSTIGTIVTWSIAGVIIANYGWPLSFYVQGAMTGVWCFFWWYIVADLPDEHPRISPTELDYIKQSLGSNVKKLKSVPPYLHILTSIPFLLMVVLHYGSFWGLYLFLTAGPTFISTVLGFNIAATGFIGSLPTLARLVATVLFGIIGDFCIAKKYLTIKVLRKSFTFFSHILPGILLLILVYWGYLSTTLCIALITFSMGLNGASSLTNLSNHQDLSPNFAGTLYGIANSVTSTTGVFAPLVTAYFTRNGNSFAEWQPVFIVGGLFYILTAVIFILFGSTTIQPWNDMSTYKETKEKMANAKGAPNIKTK